MNNFRYFFETLPWLGFFTAIILSWYFYLKARNKERMALIEKDADVSDIYSKQEIRIRFPWLKLGILITGIALGVALAAIMVFTIELQGNRLDIEPFILIGGILFGGISMIIAHFVEKPGRK